MVCSFLLVHTHKLWANLGGIRQTRNEQKKKENWNNNKKGEAFNFWEAAKEGRGEEGASVTKKSKQKLFTHWTDNLFPLHDLDNLFPLHDLDHLFPLHDLYDLYDLYDLAHVAGWEPYNLHDLEPCLLGMICTRQILHSISQRQVWI